MLEINPDGSYIFTPLLDTAGVDTFTYTVVDANGNESTATVTIEIADLGLAKSVVGQPVLLADGNYEVTYLVVAQNTGAFDTIDLSLVEDLATQFGGAFVSAGGLTIVSPTSDLGSSIAIDPAWDGDNVTEFLAGGSTLASGDSFMLEFTAIVDATAFASTADTANSVVGNGVAADSNGDPVTNANGDPVLVSDLSDAGTDPNGSNIGAVSYTHLPSPRDRTRSRMPSSA